MIGKGRHARRIIASHYVRCAGRLKNSRVSSTYVSTLLVSFRPAHSKRHIIPGYLMVQNRLSMGQTALPAYKFQMSAPRLVYEFRPRLERTSLQRPTTMLQRRSKQNGGRRRRENDEFKFNKDWPHLKKKRQAASGLDQEDAQQMGGWITAAERYSKKRLQRTSTTRFDKEDAEAPATAT